MLKADPQLQKLMNDVEPKFFFFRKQTCLHKLTLVNRNQQSKLKNCTLFDKIFYE